MSDDPTMQKADPAARRALLRRLVPLAVLGLAVATVALALARDAEHTVTTLYGLLGVTGAVSLLMLAPIWQLWWSGFAARHHRRYPPPDQPVIRDTRILTGDAAEQRGRMLQQLAVAMGLFVVLTPVAIGWVVYRVIRGQLGG